MPDLPWMQTEDAPEVLARAVAALGKAPSNVPLWLEAGAAEPLLELLGSSDRGLATYAARAVAALAKDSCPPQLSQLPERQLQVRLHGCMPRPCANVVGQHPQSERESLHLCVVMSAAYADGICHTLTKLVSSGLVVLCRCCWTCCAQGHPCCSEGRQCLH